MIPAYNAQWADSYSELEIVMACIKKGGEWTGKSGAKCGAPLSLLYKRMRRIIWPNLDDEDDGQRWHKLCRDTILESKVTVLMGPGSCVSGDTRIEDPITGKNPTIKYLYDNKISPCVMTLNGPAIATVPFIKGSETLLEITLSNGQTFKCTRRHRVLTPQGYVHAEELRNGQSLFSYSPNLPGSTSEPDLSIHARDAHGFPKKAEDYEGNYSAYCHPCDELLPSGLNIGQSFSPSQCGAPARKVCAFVDVDDLENREDNNRLYPPAFRLSRGSASPPSASWKSHAGYYYKSSISLLTERSFRSFGQSPKDCSHQIPSLSQDHDYCCRHFSYGAFSSGTSPQASLMPPWRTYTTHRTAWTQFPNRSFGYKGNEFLHPFPFSYPNNESSTFRVSVARVASIQKTHKEVYYDLTVPDGNHYFAEGAIHHNSGKTHEAAWISLCEYFCFPEETCVLVSSTTIPGLRLRVWGEISQLWSEAVQKFDFLPGHMLDSKIAITTDSLEDGEFDDRVIRDLRKAIVGVPTMQGGKFIGISKFLGIKQKRMRLIADEAQCFPAGTMVNTPSGLVAIETIKPGDLVLNALGQSRVRCTMSREADCLVSVKTTSGIKIKCTPNHPFLTQLGWVNGVDLLPFHRLISSDEAMQILQKGNNRPRKQRLLQQVLPNGDMEEAVQGLRSSVHTIRTESDILHSILQREVEYISTRNIPKSNRGSGEAGYDHCGQENKRFCQGEREGNGEKKAFREKIRRNVGRLEVLQHQNGNPNRANTFGGFPGSCSQFQDHNGEKFKKGKSPLLQNRFSVARFDAGSGSGRIVSRTSSADSEGPKSGCLLAEHWVESVEISDEENIRGHSIREKRYRVFNLEVSGHPSYSVNGFLVHNCMGSSFLSAFSNLDKNEDFKAIILGNPNDMLDPLGKAAEPKEGWDKHMQPEKTSVWETRFMGGKCVNLIGTDSPNFDFPPDKPTRFKYLISKEKIAATLSFFPKESFEYYGQCVGSMQIGTLSKRVLTRGICEANGAMSFDVNWENGNRTRIASLDAAYGGDRCVFRRGEFGRAVGGKTLLLLHEPEIVPISPGADMDAEYQIARFVKQRCESFAITPGNFFYDATGRGSLGTALAREWSAETNPVESGGVPTLRPVSLDIFTVDEKTNIRRLKLCSEHYSKRITEYWFSVRYTVESGQLRGLDTETMEELCSRVWNLKGFKYEVEPKGDMKERIGRSPDKGDCVAILCEGARRRGFQISKLANNEESKERDNWVEEKYNRHRDILKSKELTFA